MAASGQISSRFHIRASETHSVFLLFTHAVFHGLAAVFAYASAMALFLAAFDAEQLSLVYLSAAVILTGAGFLFNRLNAYFQARTLFTVVLVGLISLAILFRLGLMLSTAVWIPFFLLIWHRLLYVLTQIEFWGTAGQVFSLQQGKRLFGLIGSGENLAKIVGFALVPQLVSWLGTANLLWLSALMMGGSLLVMLTVLPQTTPMAQTTSAPSMLRLRDNLFQKRYPTLIMFSALIMVVAFFLIDFGFLKQVRGQFQSADEVARFLGVFFTAVYIISFLLRALVTGHLLNRFGLRAGLLILPAGLLLLTATALISNLLQIMPLFFWLVIGIKLLDESLQSGIYYPASQMLYQPMPAKQRVSLQTLTESIAVPVGIGLAGLGLLLMNSFPGFNNTWLLLVIGVVAAGWLLVVRATYAGYPVALQRALARRSLQGEEVPLQDNESIELLVNRLDSNYPDEVVYALALLERAEAVGVLDGRLVPLLDHPSSDVRKEAVQRLGRLFPTTAVSALHQRLARETEPDVLSTILQALCQLEESHFIDTAASYLEHPQADVRQGALIGLLGSGGVEGILLASQHLLQLIDSNQETDRLLAAQIMGKVRIRGFSRSLVRMVHDESPAVRREAIEALGYVPGGDQWPLLIALLTDQSVRGSATTALVRGGEQSLSAIAEALNGANRSPELLTRLARVCGLIGSPQAIPLLQSQMSHPDVRVRTAVFGALRRCGYQLTPSSDDDADRERVEQLLQREGAHAAWLITLQYALAQAEQMSLLQEAIHDALTATQNRLMFLLSFLYTGSAITRAHSYLQYDISPEAVGYALELLDVTLGQSHKGKLRPIFSDESLEVRYKQLQLSYPRPLPSVKESLLELIRCNGGDLIDWPRVCALYLGGVRREFALKSELESIAVTIGEDASPLRETAVWSLAQLSQTSPDLSPGITEKTNMLTVEKVIILKTISVFSQIPDELLSELAGYLQEVHLAANETLFEKGVLGETMFMIVEGKVRVHDGAVFLNHLTDRDVFGEMAILDPAPRAASITAVTDTLLLALNQDPLYALMSERPEVAQSIIRMLSRHLRARVEDVNLLRQQQMNGQALLDHK